MSENEKNQGITREELELKHRRIQSNPEEADTLNQDEIDELLSLYDPKEPIGGGSIMKPNDNQIVRAYLTATLLAPSLVGALTNKPEHHLPLIGNALDLADEIMQKCGLTVHRDPYLSGLDDRLKKVERFLDKARAARDSLKSDT